MSLQNKAKSIAAVTLLGLGAVSLAAPAFQSPLSMTHTDRVIFPLYGANLSEFPPFSSSLNKDSGF